MSNFYKSEAALKFNDQSLGLLPAVLVSFIISFILAWPEGFNSGLVLGLEVSDPEEDNICVMDETLVTLQKKSNDEKIEQKQKWLTSTYMIDSTTYKKFRVSCSLFAEEDMVLSKSLPSSDTNDDSLFLSIRGMKYCRENRDCCIKNGTELKICYH